MCSTDLRVQLFTNILLTTVMENRGNILPLLNSFNVYTVFILVETVFDEMDP